MLTSTQSVCGSASRRAARTRSRSTPAFAPAPTAIWFSPAASTTISATPVGTPSSTATPSTRTPSARSSSSAVTAGVVVADGADERDVRAGPRRGDRGVGALAAAETLDARPDDRLARPGQPLRGDHEVDVDRADDDDPPHPPPPEVRRQRGTSRARRPVVVAPDRVQTRPFSTAVAHQRRAVGQAQPAQHPLDVVLHRPRREHQPRRDLARRQSLHHQPQHVGLTRGQPRPARGRPARPYSSRTTSASPGVNTASPRGRAADGVGQRLGVVRSDEVAARAGPDRGQHVRSRVTPSADDREHRRVGHPLQSARGRRRAPRPGRGPGPRARPAGGDRRPAAARGAARRRAPATAPRVAPRGPAPITTTVTGPDVSMHPRPRAGPGTASRRLVAGAPPHPEEQLDAGFPVTCATFRRSTRFTAFSHTRLRAPHRPARARHRTGRRPSPGPSAHLPVNWALPGPCSTNDAIPMRWSSVANSPANCSASMSSPVRRSMSSPPSIAFFAAAHTPARGRWRTARRRPAPGRRRRPQAPARRPGRSRAPRRRARTGP